MKKILIVVLLVVALLTLTPAAHAYVAGSGCYWNGVQTMCYEYGFDYNEETGQHDLFWYYEWPC